jgi:GNAT superfamily N-acetyltransferase
MDPLSIRSAGPADADAVAALHAASWRKAYRDILSEAYLANAHVERAQYWQARMAAWDPARSFLALAERDGDALGFACVMADAEPAHGALLDNLHVRPDIKRGGIGRRLLTRAGAWVAATRPGTPLHLTVYLANENAVGFYRRMGGIASAPHAYRAVDGRDHQVLRFVWAAPDRIGA